MTDLEKALEIAIKAHAGTLDKQGKPYILHPLRVMLSVTDADAQIVAVLHDVVEDTSVTFEALSEHGFSTKVLDALRLVTHQAGVSYADYVIACRRNPLATAVKLADLQDNSDPNRLLLRSEKLAGDTRRLQRYLLSRRFLLDELSEQAYRAAMVELEE